MQEIGPKMVIVTDSQGNNVAGGRPNHDGGIPDDLQYIADNRGGKAEIVDLDDLESPSPSPAPETPE